MTTSHPQQDRLTLDRLLASWRGAVLPGLTAVMLLVLQPAGWAQSGNPADPPGSVARLNLMEGGVSFLPAELAGSGDATAWTPAIANRPLTSGDRLWAGPGARTELHVGSTTLRMNEQTSLDFLTLDDNVTRLRLGQGTLRLRVRTLFGGQRLEIDTPNLAFVINKPGDYRIDANPSSDTTRVVAQSGGGAIYGDSGTPLTLGSQQQGSFTGTDLAPAAPGASMQDSFDAWAIARDRREEQSVSARYIPREIVGYQQLDSYGDWSQDPGYGAIWLPRAMPADWAPYRAGHWSWISPWGWTWIDDAPWGFAPFHYGRWAQIGPRWAWVPGRPEPRPVYAPALVAFVGGGIGAATWNISLGAGFPPRPGVGWFPLAPGEAFRPAYQASPRYVTQINNNIVVNNVVNNTNVYRYQRQPSAVTVTNAADFARGRPGRGSFQAVNAGDLGRAPTTTSNVAAPVTLPPRPERRDLPAPAAAAAVPPAALFTPRSVVASQGERHDVRPEDRHEERREDRGNDQRGRPERSQGYSEPKRPATALATTSQSTSAAPAATVPVQPIAAKPVAVPAPAAPIAAASPVSPAAPVVTRSTQPQPGPQTVQPNQTSRNRAAQSEQARPPFNPVRPPETQREQPPRPVPQARVSPPVQVIVPAPSPQAAGERNAAEQAQRAAVRSQEQAQQRTQYDQHRQQQEQARQAQKTQQDQARQQQRAQQDQQRQPREQQQQQQRQQQEPRAQQARTQQQPHNAEAARAREHRPEGAPHRNSLP